MVSSTREVVDYYANLLIMQYLGKPKAYASIQVAAGAIIFPQTSVQVISFSPAPTSGSWVLSYGLEQTGTLAFNISSAALQTALRLIDGLEAVTVAGSIAAGFTITFTDVPPPALALEVFSSTLAAAGPTSTRITITETDEIIPLAVQNAFNLLGDDIAEGVQLDVLAKYIGVQRTDQGFTQQITLNDTDFLQLMRMGIIRNSAQSDLGSIQQYLFDFFPGLIQVIDTQDMHLQYLISTGIGSSDLLQMFIVQNLLPKPMGVGISVLIFAPDIGNFFGFRTYGAVTPNNTPFNSYADYQLDWPWLSYGDTP